MKRFIIAALLGLGFGPVALAAPQQIYENNGVVTSVPTIDAVIFYNAGIFDLNTIGGITNFNNNVGTGLTSIPYSTGDTLYFTNTTSGTMSDTPGFLFDTVTASTVHNASSFHNDGFITGFDFPAFPDIFVVAGGTGTTAIVADSQPVASQVGILATNIVNDGTISVGNYGLLRMVGKNITNANGILVAGAMNTGGLIFDPLDTTGGNDLLFSGFNYYVNPPGVYDLFWGVTNDATLDLSAGLLSPPDTTAVDVGLRDGITEVGLSLPLNVNTKFASYVNSYATDPSNTYFNIVFVNTNFTDVNGQTDTNITATVGYTYDYEVLGAQAGDLLEKMAIVQFALTAPDVITGQVVTNAVYLLDGGGALKTMVDYDNAGSANGYNRPNAFAITTTTPEAWLFTDPANFPYSPALIYAADTYADTTVTYEAAEYGAQIGRNPGVVDGSFSFDNVEIDFGSFITLPDPTNEAARIELTANQVDLSNARLRAEGMVTVNATNFVGMPAASDWGEINSQLGATNGSLVISNFYPTNFQRLRGAVYAWSGTWENTVTNGAAFGVFNTNTFHYHLLVVDQNLGGNFQSAIRNLSLTASNSIDVQDSLYVINQSYFNTRSLTFSSNAVFTQNASSIVGTNVSGLKNFVVNTNAVLTVDNVLDLGLDPTINQVSPVNGQYTNISGIGNFGQIEATAILFQSVVFENDGIITTLNGGSMTIDAETLDMGLVLTNQNNSMLVDGNLLLSAASIGVSNSTIITGVAGSGGSLTLQTTTNGQITDFVPGILPASNVLNNFWQVTDGFNLPVKPATGDLYATEIKTIATGNTVAQHIWAGRGDYTNVADGFIDNVVIGHLILSRQSAGAQLHFSGAGTQNGMYVDYLELDTNSLSGQGGTYRDGLFIDPNLTIYFAYCNVDPVKVESIVPNHLVWVTNIGGTNSPITLENNAGFANQMFAPVAGVYNGLFYDTNQLSSTNSGFFTFTLSSSGTFSGRLLMGPATYTFSGSGPNEFNTNGAAQVIAKYGSQSLTVNLQLEDTADGAAGVQGSVSNGTWVAQLQGDLKPVWTTANPSPYAGLYTMVLTNGGTNSVPIGDSYGCVTVSKLGVLSVAGMLADGNSYSQSVPISSDGLWPFYTYVAGGGDVLFGWIAFQSSDSGWIALQSSDAEAPAIEQTNVWWSKVSSAKDIYYPAGFTNIFNVAGSPYFVPGKNSSGLTLTNPVVILSGGGLIATTNPVAYNGKLAYTNSDLTLSINATTGSFTGRLQYPGNGASIKMDGAVLQSSDGGEGFGFFLGINDETGLVLLQSQ
jgi:hypothetical protein